MTKILIPAPLVKIGDLVETRWWYAKPGDPWLPGVVAEMRFIVRRSGRHWRYHVNVEGRPRRQAYFGNAEDFNFDGAPIVRPVAK